MNELGTALHEAGDAVGPLRPVDPADLWRQGKRRVRRRRLAGALATVGATVVTALALPIVDQPLAGVPAGQPHEPALPRNIHEPSRWIPGTDDDGAPGRLAVLGRLRIDEDRDRYFGISATTGRYRMLDLPGRVESTGASLSPDGRQVAYWIGGKTRKSSYPAQPGATKEDLRIVDPVVGYAVYDTESGRVTRQPVPSDHGIRSSEESGDGSGLLWVDNRSVVVEYGLAVHSGSVAHQSFLWSPGGDAPRRLSSDNRTMELIRLPDGSVLAARFDDTASVYVQLDQHLEPTGSTLRLPGGSMTDFSRQGRRVVVTGYLGNGGMQRVLTGVADAQGRVPSLHPVGQLAGAELLGWRGKDRVLVAARPTIPDPTTPLDVQIAIEDEQTGEFKPAGLYEVNLASGMTTRLGTAEDIGQDIQVATDLVDEPMVHGEEPPFALDPRLFWGGTGALMICGLLGFALWRRRARP